MSAGTLEQVLRTVPAVAHLGISVEDARPGQVVLRIPTHTTNLNVDGRLHTSALFAVGELAAAVAFGTHPRLAALVRLQKASRIEYLAAARKDVTAHATVTPEMLAAILAGVERDGKVQMEMPVKLMDGHGTDVADLVSVFTFRR